MDIKAELKLNFCFTDDERNSHLELPMQSSIAVMPPGSMDFRLAVWSDPRDEQHYSTLFNVWLEYGEEYKSYDKTIAFNVDIFELERFAHSVIKCIKQVNRIYGDEIKSSLTNEPYKKKDKR